MGKVMLNSKSFIDESNRRYVEFFSKYVELHDGVRPDDLDALEIERDNILQAIDVAFKDHDWKHLLCLVRVVGRQPNGFLDMRGYWDDALRCYEKAVKAARILNKKNDEAIFTLAMGIICKRQGKFSEARECVKQADIIIRSGDTSKEAQSDVLHEKGMQAFDEGNFSKSEKLHLKNLNARREISYTRGIAHSLHELGRLARIRGDFPNAKKFLEESLELRKTFSDEPGATASTLHDLGCAELDQGVRLHILGKLGEAQPHYRKAKKYFEQRLKVAKLVGVPSQIANTFHEMGRLACFTKQYKKARTHFAKSLRIKRIINNQLGISHTYLALAELECEMGNISEAERFRDESLEIKKALGDKGGIIACQYISGLIMEKRDKAKAARLFRSAHRGWSAMKIWQGEIAEFKFNKLSKSAINN